MRTFLADRHFPGKDRALAFYKQSSCIQGTCSLTSAGHPARHRVNSLADQSTPSAGGSIRNRYYPVEAG